MSVTVDRIAITGLGAVTPIGATVATFWSALLAGRSGCRRVTAFDLAGQRTEIGCEVPGFEHARVAPDPGGRATALAVAAAAEALAPGRPRRGAPVRPERVGVCIGTTMGEIRILEEHLEREVRPRAGSAPPRRSRGTPASGSPPASPRASASAGRTSWSPTPAPPATTRSPWPAT